MSAFYYIQYCMLVILIRGVGWGATVKPHRHIIVKSSMLNNKLSNCKCRPDSATMWALTRPVDTTEWNWLTRLAQKLSSQCNLNQYERTTVGLESHSGYPVQAGGLYNATFPTSKL